MKEAIVLAGGFGTRLQQAVSDVPKPMAPINGRPFLAYLLDKLQAEGIGHVILCTGYKHEQIAGFFGNRYGKIRLSYSQETTPLFTGGAIRKALPLAGSEQVVVLNGDTFFDIPLEAFMQFHNSRKNPLSVALRPVDDTSRYGAVMLDNTQHITGFREKGNQNGAGLINGGIYCLDREWLLQKQLPEKFSFEREILEKGGTEPFCGMVCDNYFIDIGIPDDYARAQAELPLQTARTLFLDRDGVINRRIAGDYVKAPAEFEFLPHVLEAMPKLAGHFRHIFVVTNQQGISKGRFTDRDLAQVHEYMCRNIEKAGGRIDKIYYCPEGEGSPNRKPAIGMAMQAQADFPDLVFGSALMVGDAISDLQFARNAGMTPVFLTNGTDCPEAETYTRFIFHDLDDFTNTLTKRQERQDSIWQNRK